MRLHYRMTANSKLCKHLLITKFWIILLQSSLYTRQCPVMYQRVRASHQSSHGDAPCLWWWNAVDNYYDLCEEQSLEDGTVRVLGSYDYQSARFNGTKDGILGKCDILSRPAQRLCLGEHSVNQTQVPSGVSSGHHDRMSHQHIYLVYHP